MFYFMSPKNIKIQTNASRRIPIYLNLANLPLIWLQWLEGSCSLCDHHLFFKVFNLNSIYLGDKHELPTVYHKRSFLLFFLHQLILIIFQSDRMLPGTGIVLTALGIFILGYLPTDQITGILIITRVQLTYTVFILSSEESWQLNAMADLPHGPF